MYGEGGIWVSGMYSRIGEEMGWRRHWEFGVLGLARFLGYGVCMGAWDDVCLGGSVF